MLQARVTAMLSETLARLSIEGHMVDVAIARPLPVGTMIPLRGEWKDGQLRLFAQDPTRASLTTTAPHSPAAPHAAPVPQAATPALPPVRTSIPFPIGEPVVASAPHPTSALPPSPGVATPPAAPARAAPTTPQQIVAELNTYRPPVPKEQAVAPAMSAPPSPGALAPVRAALAHIQAMAVEAMLSGIGAEAAVEGQKPAATVPPLVDPAMRQPLPEGAVPRAPLTAAQLAAGQQTVTPEKEVAATEKTKVGSAAGGAADVPPVDAPRPERIATATVQLPLYLPGSELPIRLQISREHRDEGGSGGERAGREPSWIVRFSSETGRLGPIHAAISLVDGHVGVQLWAERGETADWFRNRSGELRDALIASDVELDAVRISHGSPLLPEQG